MLNLIIILVFYTLDVLFVEFLYRIKIPSFYTRKIGHIIGALISLFMINILPFWGFVLVCLILIFVNLISHKFKIFNSIERAERDSVGTILYPVSVLILGIVFWEQKVIYYGSIAVMGFADSAAALIGKRFGKTYLISTSKKTLEGFSAFFGVTFIIYFALVHKNYGQIDLTQLVLIFGSAFLLACVEFLSKKGSDNISIPLLSSFLLYLLIN